jgi:methylated-DNA-[protein]-cysteine S-methyltransferase
MRPAIASWQHCRTDTPLGPLQLARTTSGLCGAWFVEDQKHAPDTARFAPEHYSPKDALLQTAAEQLAAYFEQRLHTFDLPLDLTAGTAFQQAVWQALLTLPHGRLGSYGALSQQLSKPLASRAVGAAVGRNPISIIVPCHRVLGSTGQLTGYAGGLWRKQALLKLEGHALF